MLTARLHIPQEILDSARLSAEELKRELAVARYAQRRLAIGKARELAGAILMGPPAIAGYAADTPALRGRTPA